MAICTQATTVLRLALSLGPSLLTTHFAPKVNPKDISIDADLDELSVVVSYVVEITHLDASGASVGSEKVRGHLYCCVLVPGRRLFFMRTASARRSHQDCRCNADGSGLGLELQPTMYWYSSRF